MITVLSRAIHDEFTYSLFEELVNGLDCDYEAYYTWTDSKSYNTLGDIKFTRPNVIIGIKDWLEQHQIDLLQNVFTKHPHCNFVLVTSSEDQCMTADNLQTMSWGGDWTNQSTLYSTLEPVFDKNFKSDKTFINLNNAPKQHRIVALSYLIGNNYQGHFSFIGKNSGTYPDTIDTLCPWKFSQNSFVTDTHIENTFAGYLKLINELDLTNGNDDNIYKHIGKNNNVTNFDRNLRALYQNSFVELVAETTVEQIFFTEKTLNSIYACNFFIILNKQGAVQHLRQIGFDVFDDIINHSYDTIADPFERMTTAIESNRQIITDSSHAKESWADCVPRFGHNIKTARNIYSFYKNRAGIDFSKLKWK